MAGGRKANDNGKKFEGLTENVFIDKDMIFETHPKIQLKSGLNKEVDYSFKGIDGLTHFIECRYQEVPGTVSDKVIALIFNKFLPIYDDHQIKVGGFYIVVNSQMAINKSLQHFFYDNKAYLHETLPTKPDFVSLIQLFELGDFEKHIHGRGVTLGFTTH